MMLANELPIPYLYIIESGSYYVAPYLYIIHDGCYQLLRKALILILTVGWKIL
jgi:hypothetical protein